MAVDSGDDAFAATVAPVSPPVAAAGAPAAFQLAEVARERFVISREIARGGMGKIVAADDARLGRPVALKVLIDGGHSPEALELAITRFEREALITARLQHPGIVPIYEAGRWPSGEPFFVMKLVHGRPLDRVIADCATLDARLALLPRIAAATDAIAYAHSQRIVHRDLKPANVLIGDFGETVVIDWGLAKDLDAADPTVSGPRVGERVRTATPRPALGSAPADDDSSLTLAGAVLGTPAYMPPEQARGEAVDQRADVFSLGAMLYHLLAGALPYDARTTTDVIAAAALGKIVPLTERARRAPAELVAIVHRAMAFEPSDRYPSAGELADEVRRFLTGQLVGAHHYTRGERIARFVRRHRGAVIVSAIAVATIAVGGTMAIHRIVDARDAAQAALAEDGLRKHAAEILIDQMFRDAESQLRSIGRLDLLQKLGIGVRTYFDSLTGLPGGIDLRDSLRMARAIDPLGESELSSGDPGKALATWTRERDRLTASIGDGAGAATLPHRRLIAHFDFERGTAEAKRGQPTVARNLFERARGEYDVVLAEGADDRETLLAAADVHDQLGDLLRYDAQTDAAGDEYVVAKALRDHANSLGNGDPIAEIRGLAESHVRLAAIADERGDPGAALELYRKAAAERASIRIKQADNVDNLFQLAQVDVALADALTTTGALAEALALERDAKTIAEELVQRDSTNAERSRLLGIVCSDVGYSELALGADRDALAELSHATEIEDQLVNRDAANTRWKNDAARSYVRAGDVQLALGALADAEASYRRALELRLAWAQKNPTSIAVRRALAWTHYSLAHLAAERGDREHARPWYDETLAARQKLATETPERKAAIAELAMVEIEYGRWLLGEPGGADGARARALIAAGRARIIAVLGDDRCNLEWSYTLVAGQLAAAAAARTAGDRAAALAALHDAARVVATELARAPDAVAWKLTAAEVALELADAEPATATANREHARALLEPLAAAQTMPQAPSAQALLARARGHR